MSDASSSKVSDMLVTVKAREIQRGMMAEWQGQRESAARHYLAAAHLELVLASDYAAAGDGESACRSRISAASCLWRGGLVARAREELTALMRECPEQERSVQEVLNDLARTYPES
jgi:hypothetical protein